MAELWPFGLPNPKLLLRTATSRTTRSIIFRAKGKLSWCLKQSIVHAHRRTNDVRLRPDDINCTMMDNFYDKNQLQSGERIE